MTDVDVIVVGAGLAGLTAAHALVDLGATVQVLEAADRVGGRTRGGFTADGQWLELGGQWVSDEHTALRALVDRFGLQLVDAATSGRVVHVHDGRVVEAQALAQNHIELDSATAQFTALVEAVDMEQPWRTPDAAVLDEQTFAGWIRTVVPDAAARAQFTAACAALFVPDPTEVSLLHAAFYFRSTGLIGALRGIDRQAQEWRIDGGPSALCDRMAAGLGDVVRLNAPVHKLAHNDGVLAVTDDGSRYTARHAIVTTAPPMAARIRYDPILPSDRDQLSQRLHSIAVVKIYLVYARPFWRDAGLSGEAVIEGGPIPVVMDNTPPGYAGGVLVGFIEGADSLKWGLRSAAERQQVFVETAMTVFGEQAANPVEYLEYDWSMNEFTRGCYSGHFPPGAWTSYGSALTAPVGAIHWAGTETAREWTGYMEGAVRSGERAARDVMASSY
ncbi:flavin monoamine oxidase family protein [Mycolicibacterium komossense]|uniref:FAD-dependent oxidoreductase n=1 Tax=Mycolicibacterium komossense TaxID=1779 RepID=A0ABT3CIP9_9MYCO|nr:FAD-dependent oxidoreductase [Mycolicibacterium komossense]MCV7229358.1 FAD-dependent oxidoreductase [Mycolicibacterium komossense]